MSARNSATQDRFTPDEIIQLLGIKKSAYYERLKFLGIKAHKDEGGKAYLDSEQVELLEKLESHVKATGKMEGFEFSPGEDEEVETEDDSTEKGGKLAVKGSSKLAASTTSDEKPDSVIEQEIPQTQQDFSQGMEGIIRQAAEIKAQGLAMPDLVALQLSSQMTFEDLPADLKEKVTAVREAASPKMNPASVASNLLAQYRSSRSGN
ncbi:MAG: hypothetical protein QNJ63_09755 [Calothrix sp. MO_192.B10]|nr:hypothetical protein [Calothrix sp. MO_192.B10]